MRGSAAVALGLLLVASCGKDDKVLKVTGIQCDRSDCPPVKADVEGGTYIVIKGNRFMKDGPRNAKVYFGTRQGTVVRFQSDSELIVQTPGGKEGDTVDVLVIFDPGGQMKIPNAIKFVDRMDTGPTVEDLNTSDKKKK